jgi:prepilin-type N-terminal cleavage/methylation domain-containing protein/prepilin-type processing-associated H-X9-DG protein
MLTHIRRSAFSLVELLVVIAILALMIGLILSGVQNARAASARTLCQNNLRQIGLGLSSYHTASNHFPKGLTVPAKPGEPDGYADMGWHTRLLPYIEQSALWQQAVDAYKQYPHDFTKSPPHPFNVAVKVYGCPTDVRVSQPRLARNKHIVGLTSYLGVTGSRTGLDNGMVFVNSKVTYADVTDGTSNTLHVGERPPSHDLWYGWWYASRNYTNPGFGDMFLGVGDYSPRNDPYVPDCGDTAQGFKPGKLDSMCSTFHFWSLHSGGGHFLFVDGSVRFLAYGASPIIKSLATRNGGEAVSLPD